jgi:hypothetical protein
MSTDEELSQPQSPIPYLQITTKQQSDSQGSTSTDDNNTYFWERSSMGAKLNSSQGRGKATDPEVSRRMSSANLQAGVTASLTFRVSTDSTTATITTSGALVGDGSAGSQHIVSTSVGIGDGRTGVDTEKEGKNELTSPMSSQDMDMSTSESTDQSKQSSQQSLHPPTRPPPSSPV